MKANVSGRLRMMSVLAAAAASLNVGMPSFGTGNTARARPGRVVHRGGTFNVGRNAEKRAARAADVVSRRRAITEVRLGLRGVKPAKGNGRLTIKMLSDRRLRQRGVAA